MKKWMIYLMLAVLWLAPACFANPQSATIHPFVKGSFAQILAQNAGKPFLMVFWSETCTYCMEELTMLGKLQKKYPEQAIVVVATDPFLDEKIVWKTLAEHDLRLAYTWVFGESFPEIIYRDVDKGWRGELPLTLFVDAQGKQFKHLGIVNEEILHAWFERPTL
ncbi:MAG: TlpA disulfide reductase family protein [Nitrosomonas sp.]|nr:TlpA family protein disulfide reductase [Nitrosomonas sp.]